jgi:hypothetical protein
MVYYGAPEGEHAPLAHFPPTASVVGLHPDVCFGPDCAGAGQPGTSWKFALSGDSRNCGEIVTPAIAAGVLDGASFYSRLGDYRAIYMFDEDYLRTHPQPAISDYENAAWPDFIKHRLKPFGKVPVFLAVGNHELIPPKTPQRNPRPVHTLPIRFPAQPARTSARSRKNLPTHSNQNVWALDSLHPSLRYCFVR